MSEKLPRVTANEMIKVVEKLGFRFSRQSGSHKIYKNDEGKRVTIAYHSGKILHPKVVKSIFCVFIVFKIQSLDTRINTYQNNIVTSIAQY